MTKRHGGQFYRANGIIIRQYTGSFTGKSYGCLSSKAKSLNIIIKGFLAQPHSYLDKTRVTGILYNLSKGLAPITSISPTINPFTTDQYMAGVHKDIIFVNYPVLQSSSCSDYLKGRAWLKTIGDSPVPPIFLGIISKIIQIITRPIGQGQDSSGFRIHYNYSTARSFKLIYGLIQFPFYYILNNFIYGQ